jgi:endonuclease/exonuclease/phosphatase family metal-dependent hydrolase
MDPRAPTPPRLGRRALQAVLGLACVYALFMAYRVLGVYRYQPGECGLTRMTDERTHRAPPAPQQRPIEVMTFNIKGQAALLRRSHLREVAAAIAAVDPDLVGLQEVHRGTWQSRFTDQPAQVLAELEAFSAHFGTSTRAMGGEYGNAVLTRGRIADAEVVPLPGLGEPRSMLRARVEIDGLELDFLVTHLTSWGRVNRRIRADQIRCLREHLERNRRPYVLVGDLNAPPHAPEIQALFEGAIVELCGDPGDVTFRLTDQRLDYILVGPGWEVLETRVLRSGPSDHWPVVARLRWRGVEGSRRTHAVVTASE